MLRTPSMFRLLALILAVTVAGCGDDDPVAPRIEDTTFATGLGVDLAASTRTSSGLYYRDIVVGTGAIASRGTAVSVRYSGALANGTVFDSGGPARTPFNFTVGSNAGIPGFEEGTIGMRVGGKRQVIIPPNRGYGSVRNGPIPANSILVFTLELLNAN